MRGQKKIFCKAIAQPFLAVKVFAQYVSGMLYHFYYKLTGRRFVAGYGLRVQRRLKIRGPGRIVFGARVYVGDTTRLWTYTRDAIIEIGDNVYLNGTHVWCAEHIKIEEDSIIGRAEIMDTNFHSTHACRHDPEAPVKTQPIVIGRNVWVGARAAVLPGTLVGPDAVIGYGAICTGTLQGGMLYVGNPARAVRKVPTAHVRQSDRKVRNRLRT